VRDNDAVTQPREIVVLGATGSIGTQAADVVRHAAGTLRIVGLASGGARVDELVGQVVEFGVTDVAVTDPDAARAVREALAAGGLAAEVIDGPDAAAHLARRPCDVVLNAITGSIGLPPTLAALKAGRTLALANKESLVAGGPLVHAVAKPDQIVPVDSEHSALAQCLRAGRRDEVRRLLLTASGGPFRGRARAELAYVRLADALAHPTWDMGPVVTINSATLVNKGLEVIEAHELFAIGYDDIEVLVHPQSQIHSMVEFVDGSTIAQASLPDMRLPIALGLAWPDRIERATRPMDWTQPHRWDFEPLDDDAFPSVSLAVRAGRSGAVVPAIYNAANEELVAGFRAGTVPFLAIVDTLARVLDAAPDFGNPRDVADVFHAERWARRYARKSIDDLTQTPATAAGGQHR